MRGEDRETDFGNDNQASKRTRVRCLANLLSHKHGTALPPSNLVPLDSVLDDVTILDSPDHDIKHSCQDFPPPLVRSSGALLSGASLSEASKKLDSSIKNAHREWKAAGGIKEESPLVEWNCSCPHPGQKRVLEGDATVLLLSGEETASRIWTSLLPLLRSKRFDAIHRPELKCTAADLGQVEAEALALAEKSGTQEKPLHVAARTHLQVALGSGAVLALSLAAKRPDLVKRLVLASPKFPDTRQSSSEEVVEDSCANSSVKSADLKVDLHGGIAALRPLLRRVTQPTLTLSSDDDPEQSTSLHLASCMDDCRYFDLGPKSFPFEGSDLTTLLSIVTDFLHEESDAVPFPFMRR